VIQRITIHTGSEAETFNAINTRGFRSYEVQPNKQDMPRNTMSTYDVEPVMLARAHSRKIMHKVSDI